MARPLQGDKARKSWDCSRSGGSVWGLEGGMEASEAFKEREGWTDLGGGRA